MNRKLIEGLKQKIELTADFFYKQKSFGGYQVLISVIDDLMVLASELKASNDDMEALSLHQELAEKLQEITHNGADPYYGYTKILWMKNHEPENWQRTKLFLPPNDYVIYKLRRRPAAAGRQGGPLGRLCHPLEGGRGRHGRRRAVPLRDAQGRQDPG
jgi:hypothetical protein